ncbi:hypothetical protein D9613_012426 [Agrocybe pediades]|uniref:Nephrocystin 3-like N-terminal domain-containing protein n=1 Tax=Agrocybe pediades TaxID=84607 RepID=A0A8H4QSW2_9AGAR|nr:hypothetical protein D9613_012426 [Agrocybe pediades]
MMLCRLVSLPSTPIAMDTNSPRPLHVPLFSPQTLVMGGTITQVLGNYNEFNGVQGFTALAKGGFERLSEASAPSAFHDSGDSHVQPKCHPNTRVAVLNSIVDSITERRQPAAAATSSSASFICLTGPAGAGKSAIASTIAGRCHDEGLLLASFFFRLGDQTRNNMRPFFATIAYQICLAIPQARNEIVASVERDPLIFRKSLSVQFNTLLVNPIIHLLKGGLFDVPSGPCCIVIDGLDECVDKKARCELLEVLASGITRTSLPFVFLIASRPEHDITSLLNSRSFAAISQKIYLDEKYLPDDDIRLYLRDSFNTIKMDHPSKNLIPHPWPCDNILNELVQKASGQFIYATTVVKYVSSSRHNPVKRLGLLLDLPSDHKDMPFAELDELYKHILSAVEDIESLIQILSFFWLTDPVCPLDYVDIMLQRKTEDVIPLLSDLASLLDVELDFRTFTQGQSIYKVKAALRFIALNFRKPFAKDVILHSLSVFSIHRLHGVMMVNVLGVETSFRLQNLVDSVILFLKELQPCTVSEPIHDVHPHLFEECLRCALLEIYLDPGLRRLRTLWLDPGPSVMAPQADEDRRTTRKLLAGVLELREKSHLERKE